MDPNIQAQQPQNQDTPQTIPEQTVAPQVSTPRRDNMLWLAIIAVVLALVGIVLTFLMGKGGIFAITGFIVGAVVYKKSDISTARIFSAAAMVIAVISLLVVLFIKP